MFHESQLQELRDRLGQETRELCLILEFNGENQDLNDSLSQLATELCTRVPVISSREKAVAKHLSWIEIVAEKARGVCYSALPTEGEWPPFLRTLERAVAGEVLALKPDQIARVTTEPIRMDIYVMPGCVHCPKVVERCNQIALSLDNVQSWIIDATAAPEKARELGIRSTPTIVIDGKVRWVGDATLDQILGLLKPVDNPWPTVLKSQILAGALEDVVEQVLSNADAAKALPGLLESPELSLHVAVIRIVEDAAAKDVEKARNLAEPLCRLLKHANAQVRGDAAYGLGLLGIPDVREKLKDCLDDPDEDVRDTVEEALEMLEEAGN